MVPSNEFQTTAAVSGGGMWLRAETLSVSSLEFGSSSSSDEEEEDESSGMASSLYSYDDKDYDTRSSFSSGNEDDDDDDDDSTLDDDDHLPTKKQQQPQPRRYSRRDRIRKAQQQSPTRGGEHDKPNHSPLRSCLRGHKPSKKARSSAPNLLQLGLTHPTSNSNKTMMSKDKSPLMVKRTATANSRAGKAGLSLLNDNRIETAAAATGGGGGGVMMKRQETSESTSSLKLDIRVKVTAVTISPSTSRSSARKGRQEIRRTVNSSASLDLETGALDFYKAAKMQEAKQLKKAPLRRVCTDPSLALKKPPRIGDRWGSSSNFRSSKNNKTTTTKSGDSQSSSPLSKRFSRDRGPPALRRSCTDPSLAYKQRRGDRWGSASNFRASDTSAPRPTITTLTRAASDGYDVEPQLHHHHHHQFNNKMTDHREKRRQNRRKSPRRGDRSTGRDSTMSGSTTIHSGSYQSSESIMQQKQQQQPKLRRVTSVPGVLDRWSSSSCFVPKTNQPTQQKQQQHQPSNGNPPLTMPTTTGKKVPVPTKVIVVGGPLASSDYNDDDHDDSNRDNNKMGKRKNRRRRNAKEIPLASSERHVLRPDHELEPAPVLRNCAGSSPSLGSYVRRTKTFPEKHQEGGGGGNAQWDAPAIRNNPQHSGNDLLRGMIISTTAKKSSRSPDHLPKQPTTISPSRLSASTSNLLQLSHRPSKRQLLVTGNSRWESTGTNVSSRSRTSVGGLVRSNPSSPDLLSSGGRGKVPRGSAKDLMSLSLQHHASPPSVANHERRGNARWDSSGGGGGMMRDDSSSGRHVVGVGGLSRLNLGRSTPVRGERPKVAQASAPNLMSLVLDASQHSNTSKKSGNARWSSAVSKRNNFSVSSPEAQIATLSQSHLGLNLLHQINAQQKRTSPEAAAGARTSRASGGASRLSAPSLFHDAKPRMVSGSSIGAGDSNAQWQSNNRTGSRGICEPKRLPINMQAGVDIGASCSSMDMTPLSDNRWNSSSLSMKNKAEEQNSDFSAPVSTRSKLGLDLLAAAEGRNTKSPTGRVSLSRNCGGVSAPSLNKLSHGLAFSRPGDSFGTNAHWSSRAVSQQHTAKSGLETILDLGRGLEGLGGSRSRWQTGSNGDLVGLAMMDQLSTQKMLPKRRKSRKKRRQSKQGGDTVTMNNALHGVLEKSKAEEVALDPADTVPVPIKRRLTDEDQGNETKSEVNELVQGVTDIISSRVEELEIGGADNENVAQAAVSLAALEITRCARMALRKERSARSLVQNEGMRSSSLGCQETIAECASRDDSASFSQFHDSECISRDYSFDGFDEHHVHDDSCLQHNGGKGTKAQGFDSQAQAPIRKASVLSRQEFDGSTRDELTQEELQAFVCSRGSSKSTKRRSGPQLPLRRRSVEPMEDALLAFASNTESTNVEREGRLSVSHGSACRLPMRKTSNEGSVPTKKRNGMRLPSRQASIDESVGGKGSTSFPVTNVIGSECDDCSEVTTPTVLLPSSFGQTTILGQRRGSLVSEYSDIASPVSQAFGRLRNLGKVPPQLSCQSPSISSVKRNLENLGVGGGKGPSTLSEGGSVLSGHKKPAKVNMFANITADVLSMATSENQSQMPQASEDT